LLARLLELESLKDKSDEQRVIGEFMGMFFAGTDSTSFLVAVIVYYLWKYP